MTVEEIDEIDHDENSTCSSDNSFNQSIQSSSSCSMMIESSFVSSTFDSQQLLKELTDEQVEQMFRKVYQRNSESSTEVLPKLFINSMIQLIRNSDKLTCEVLDSQIQETLLNNIGNDVEHSYFEKLLLLRNCLLHKNVRGYDSHVEALKSKEMDLANTELTNLEDRLQQMIEVSNKIPQ
jgi:uncharacterized membrane protein YheB (UPF0754 family)